MRPVVVIGESLVDLVVDATAEPLVAHPRYGGSPFNVAVGLARRGVPVRYAGPACGGFFGARLARFAAAETVDMTLCTPCDGDACLALAIREADSVRFDSFTRPEVLTRIDAVPAEAVAAAAVVHAGSIALLADPARETVLAAFDVPGPCRTLDPNVRPAVLADPAAYRDRLAPFLARADVVKLSADDADFLYGGDPVAAARRLHDGGVRTVVLTRGAAGAHLVHDGGELAVPAVPPAAFVDATGAGDAFMAAMVAGMVAALTDTGGVPPAGVEAWRAILSDAARAASRACEVRGGAEAMPPAHRK